jgi:hypothetical protein
VAEIRHILRPGGRYAFLEHVAAPDGTALRRIQPDAACAHYERAIESGQPDSAGRAALNLGILLARAGDTAAAALARHTSRQLTASTTTSRRSRRSSWAICWRDMATLPAQHRCCAEPCTTATDTMRRGQPCG